MTHYAHSGTAGDRSNWQLLGDHLHGVADIARANATPLGLGACAEVLGRFHDLGTYNPEFDRRLRGEYIRVDHSTAGGSVLLAEVSPGLRPVAEALAYAILGHHAGLIQPFSRGSIMTNRRGTRLRK